MGKQAGSRLTGPLRLQKSSDKSEGRYATVTVAALTTNTAETYSITDADALVGDVVIVSPNVAPEAGWGLEAAWVDSAGVIKVRARNHSGGTLTGGSLRLNYQILK
jgi:hypothetical protein